MTILVTGSAGHLGEALMHTLRAAGRDALGIDRKSSDCTDRVGSIVESDFVDDCMHDVSAVLHTATLHKPHVATHTRQAFIDTNISGTLNLLEAAVRHGVEAFIFTSTTSAFGDALRPPPEAPAAWITEDVAPIAKNIYGATKTAAEDLCRLFHRNQQLSCLILRTSRFFPEPDDDPARRSAFGQDNLQVCELLYRRVDIKDVVSAHLLAIQRAAEIGFDRFIISASTPFMPTDLPQLRRDPATVVDGRIPGWREVFAARNWRMLDDIERVYVNHHARERLGWQPQYDFARAIDDLRNGRDHRSELAQRIGTKGYHDIDYPGGIFPID